MHITAQRSHHLPPKKIGIFPPQYVLRTVTLAEPFTRVNKNQIVEALGYAYNMYSAQVIE